MERLEYDRFIDLIKYIYNNACYSQKDCTEVIKLGKNILNNEYMLGEPLKEKSLKIKPFLAILSREKYNDEIDINFWGSGVLKTCLKEMAKQNSEYIEKYVLMYCYPKPIDTGKIKTFSSNIILIAPIYTNKITEDIKYDLYINDSFFITQVSIAFRDIYSQGMKPWKAFILSPPTNNIREIDGKIIYTVKNVDLSKRVICVDKNSKINIPKCISISEDC